MERNKELIQAIITELNMQNNDVINEVIGCYIAEGEKQIKNYLNVDKLTSTLLLIVKGYTTTKLKENNFKYNARVVRTRGLDNYFKDNHIGILNKYKKMMNVNYKNYGISKKNERIARENKARVNKERSKDESRLN